MNPSLIMSFVVTMIVSAILIPLVMKAGKELGIVAHKNKRTVHKVEVPRIGGYAIYISSLIGAVIFLKTDPQINAILIAGFLVFFVGLIDDVHDLSPKTKLAVELIAALIVIVYGDIYLKGFDFMPSNWPPIIPGVITVLWIVGITNAINLIDGLDGLSSGISIIVLFTVSMTSLTSGRTDIASLSLVLAGAIMGFLFYNFHPAKIFLGDCGALYIGFMISVISLLGFGYNVSTFFTLGAPIVVLMVPIMDTFIAIIRRKVHHKSFSEADRNHLHHKLMFSLELGQTKSVLILYAVTVLFSLCSYLYLFDKVAATILFIALMVLFELFVEATNMIDRKYKPLLTILNIFIKSEYLPSIKDTKPYQRIIQKAKKKYAVILILVIGIVFSMVFVLNNEEKVETQTPVTTKYIESQNETSLMSDIYNQLVTAINRGDKTAERQLVAAYFVSDYYTLSNKENGEIGGIDYFYAEKKDDFTAYARNEYYKEIQTDINPPEVIRYDILSNVVSYKALSGLEDYSYYDVKVQMTFKEINPILDTLQYTTTVTLIEKDQKFSVVAMENDNG